MGAYDSIQSGMNSPESETERFFTILQREGDEKDTELQHLLPLCCCIPSLRLSFFGVCRLD